MLTMSTASQEGPGLAKVYPGLRLFGMLNSLADPLAEPGAHLISDSNCASRAAPQSVLTKDLTSHPFAWPRTAPCAN